MNWFLFALMTALFESLKDVASKKALTCVNEYVIAWSWTLFPLPFLLIALQFQPLPSLGNRFWLAVVSGGILHTVSFILYMKAIKSSDLSLTIPLIAFTPLFLLLTSPLMVGEFPSLVGIVGILLIVAGSYVLNISKLRDGWLAPFSAILRERGTRLMLIVALLWSIGANIDKVGVQHSSPSLWITAVCSCISLFMMPIVLWKVRGVRRQLTRHVKRLTLIGFCLAIGMIAQMHAIMLTLVPYVISVKRLSIALSVLLGYVLFHEQHIRERLAGVALMIVGVIVITVGS